MRCLILAGVLAASASAAADDAVDAYIRQEMRDAHIPGLSLAVVHHGRTVKHAWYGLADVELGVPVGPETKFAIASMTKSFTAAAVVLLAQDGKLGLDDPISRHLDAVPETWKGITVRHLLNHTSGIKDHYFDFPFYPPVPALSRLNRRLEFTDQELLKALGEAGLNFTPGERFAYSGSGYVLLGMIIRKVTGKPWGDALQERIFRPLGMNATRLIDVDEIIPGRASGYRWVKGALRNGDYTGQTFSSAADVAMLTTAGDLAKWHVALGTDPRWKKALADMVTPGLLSDGEEAMSPFGTSYGLGWTVSAYKTGSSHGHSGSFTTGFSSIMLRFPDRELSVMVLTNQHSANPVRIGYQIAALFDPALQPPHAMEVRPDDAPDVTRRVERFVTGLLGAPDTLDGVTPFLRRRLSGYPQMPPGERPSVSVSFIASENVGSRPFERRGSRIARVGYYKALVGGDPIHLTVYFDESGLIADHSGY